jgi:hypothetical protein
MEISFNRINAVLRNNSNIFALLKTEYSFLSIEFR